MTGRKWLLSFTVTARLLSFTITARNVKHCTRFEQAMAHISVVSRCGPGRPGAGLGFHLITDRN